MTSPVATIADTSASSTSAARSTAARAAAATVPAAETESMKRPSTSAGHSGRAGVPISADRKNDQRLGGIRIDQVASQPPTSIDVH